MIASRYNYRAFREPGRVERTLFLLRFISNAELRRVIRAETTKIEAYNELLDWVCFGGAVVKSGDPAEPRIDQARSRQGIWRVDPCRWLGRTGLKDWS